MPVQGPHISLVARALKANRGPRCPVYCVSFAEDQPTPKEPLMSASFTSHPWERIATDLFELKGKLYLIVVDCYSRWFEITQLHIDTSRAVIQALKELFAVHGIPDLIIFDNGLQYSEASKIPFANLQPNMALCTPQGHQDTPK